MRIRTHLIAMPWAKPDTPSIQLGSLKAHLDQALGGQADCHPYSAFFTILHELGGPRFGEVHREFDAYDEYAYLLLYLRRFGPAEFRRQPGFARLVKGLRVSWAKPLSVGRLDGLDRATRKFLDDRVGANLLATGINLVGFTLNFDQLYASVYAAEHLRQKHPAQRFLFVFGGCSASLPAAYKLLTRLEIKGVVVIGEGERKLESLVRTLRGLTPEQAAAPLAAVRGMEPGIIEIGEKVDLVACSPACYATQVDEIDELPLPDYDEYFQALRDACADKDAYAAFCGDTSLNVEGSRGCFSRCDFCGLNRTWKGFRAHDAQRVVTSTIALTRKYGTSQVQFVDSVCDAWAREYAQTLLRQGVWQRSFMELRGSHHEEFWTLLSLAGVRSVQVGIEAVAPLLLKAIGKGISVVRNLATQKYLSELGVWTNNNLITHHPRSTLADVAETRRILPYIPHWNPFDLSPFLLMAGSRLYESVSLEERAALKSTCRIRLSAQAARYALEYSYQVPPCLDPGPAVHRAWNAFERGYIRQCKKYECAQPRLDVVRVDSNTLRITDARASNARFYELCGDQARVYECCHAGLTLEEIARETNFSHPTIASAIAPCIKAKLILQVEDHYLSVALRPRDELIRRWAGER